MSKLSNIILNNIILSKLVVLSVICMSSFVWAAEEKNGAEKFNLDSEQEYYRFMNQSDEDIRHVLPRINKGRTPLVMAASLEVRHDVARLLALKADPNQEDGTGETPLCAAAQKYYTSSIVRLLLEAKANANQRNRRKETPLEWALRRGSGMTNNDVLQQLLDAGADRNAPTSAGVSPLCLTIGGFTHVRLEEAQALVAAGAIVGEDELAAAHRVRNKSDGPEVLALVQNAPARQKSFRLLASQALTSKHLISALVAFSMIAVAGINYTINMSRG